MASASAGRAMGGRLPRGGEQPRTRNMPIWLEPGQTVQHGEGGAATAGERLPSAGR